MNKRTSLACIIVAGAIAVYFWSDAARRAKHEADLESRVHQLEDDLVAAKAAAASSADQESERAELNKLKSEVIQLRAEVTQRRGSGALADKVQAENSRLQAENRELRGKAAVAAANPASAGEKATMTEHLAESPPQAANDPLAFYRRNPELMRRYFPAMYRQMHPTNPPSATPAAQ